MTQHKVGTHEEWLAARNELLERENEHAQRSEELARQRQELPWVPVEKEYSFGTDGGTKTLAELFDGRSQLLAYNIMFGPEYTGACPGCSNLADHLDGGVVHLNHRDVTLLCMSRAPFEAPDRDFVVPYYHQLLDRTPKERVDEFRAFRHDEYEEDGPRS
jgi:predicted dithiol-disulfide oxidoreductase (DUF899 family)